MVLQISVQSDTFVLVEGFNKIQEIPVILDPPLGV